MTICAGKLIALVIPTLPNLPTNFAARVGSGVNVGISYVAGDCPDNVGHVTGRNALGCGAGDNISSAHSVRG